MTAAAPTSPLAEHRRFLPARARPVALPLARVIAAAKVAYLERRLSAQGPAPACRYRDEAGCGCPIGVSVSDAEAAAFELATRGAPVRELAEHGLIVTDDLAALRALQLAHDDWAQAAARGGPDHKAGEARLRVLLGIDPAPRTPRP